MIETDEDLSPQCECVICYENGIGLCCPGGHFICQKCLVSYLAENAFPKVFQLRQNRCAVECPAEGCQCTYNAVMLFQLMPTRERARYLSILRDTTCTSSSSPSSYSSSTSSISSTATAFTSNAFSRNMHGKSDGLPRVDLNLLRSALLDVMTLRCPTCKTPVDPYPDACSAVMCLNCGNHYCNYCFKAFATGLTDKDRAAAHAHVASHNNADHPEGRDAFLSAETVASGQSAHQALELEKCLALAMCSPEYGANGRHEVALALILCHNEVSDLGIDMLHLWKAAESRVSGASTRSSSSSASSSPLHAGTFLADPNSSSSPTKFSQIDNAASIGMNMGSSFVTGGNGFGDNKQRRRKVVVRKWASQATSDDAKTPDGASSSSRNNMIIGNSSLSSDMTEISETDLPPYPVSTVPTDADSLSVAREEEDNRIKRQGAVQLANAIITNNTLAVSQILHTYQDRLDLDYIDPKHGHPLASLAILAGQPQVAIQLLERGADPLKRNSSGRSVLYIATESGIASVLRSIVRKHPTLDLNQPITTEIQRYCCIHVAARYNHGHIIRGLAKLGVNLDVEENEHGYTPLTLALVLGHEWAATELMTAGAQVRIAAMNGRTPMFVAAEKGLGEIIKLMVTHSKIDVDEPVVMPSGLRLLHVAAFHKQPHVVSQLIAMGADINLLDDEGGYNPLTMAIIGTNVAAALELIEAGADVRISSQSGRKPMYVAIEKGLTEVVRTLVLSKGVNVNDRTTSEPSAAKPLHVAILHGQSHLIPILVKMGADVNAVDQEKFCTPLIMAAILQDEWAIRQLIRAGADPTKLSREGRSATYIAAEKGHSGIIRLLIEECGVNINAPTTTETHKGTPLHVAAMFDNVHTVSQLLAMGADVNAVDALGRRPVDLAKEASSYAALYILAWHMKNSCPEPILQDPQEVPSILLGENSHWEHALRGMPSNQQATPTNFPGAMEGIRGGGGGIGGRFNGFPGLMAFGQPPIGHPNAASGQVGQARYQHHGNFHFNFNPEPFQGPPFPNTPFDAPMMHQYLGGAAALPPPQVHTHFATSSMQQAQHASAAFEVPPLPFNNPALLLPQRNSAATLETGPGLPTPIFSLGHANDARNDVRGGRGRNSRSHNHHQHQHSNRDQHSGRGGGGGGGGGNAGSHHFTPSLVDFPAFKTSSTSMSSSSSSSSSGSGGGRNRPKGGQNRLGAPAGETGFSSNLTISTSSSSASSSYAMTTSPTLSRSSKKESVNISPSASPSSSQLLSAEGKEVETEAKPTSGTVCDIGDDTKLSHEEAQYLRR